MTRHSFSSVAASLLPLRSASIPNPTDLTNVSKLVNTLNPNDTQNTLKMLFGLFKGHLARASRNVKVESPDQAALNSLWTCMITFLLPTTPQNVIVTASLSTDTILLAACILAQISLVSLDKSHSLDTIFSIVYREQSTPFISLALIRAILATYPVDLLLIKRNDLTSTPSKPLSITLKCLMESCLDFIVSIQSTASGTDDRVVFVETLKVWTSKCRFIILPISNDSQIESLTAQRRECWRILSESVSNWILEICMVSLDDPMVAIGHKVHFLLTLWGVSVPPLTPHRWYHPCGMTPVG